ncbi:MAG: hypothetical protein O2855_08865 [Planctomycetota bacterium]|nr:hypothetical protein [Planctomycetota bacterium]
MRCIARFLVGIACSSPAAAPIEQPNMPQWVLAQCPFQLEVTVLSIEEKALTDQITNVWHRVRIERVLLGDGLEAGDETAVVSQVRSLAPGTVGSTGDRGPFSGPNGLPIKGDRARIFADGTAAILKTRSPNGWQRAKPLLAFVAADDEYRSEITMPFLAGLVERAGIARTMVHYATADDGRGSPLATPDFAARTSLTESHGLRSADGSVLYMRFRELQSNPLSDFADATTRGLPLVGFRTSTHAFRYAANSGPGADQWNEQFPRQQFGTGWSFHHGHSSKTRILPPTVEAARHPVLSGVSIPPEGVIVPSWLYNVEPLAADCRVLLWGESVDSERPNAPQRQPILWVREVPRTSSTQGSREAPAEFTLPPQRIAFSTLGHPGDFANAEVRLIAVHMCAWAMREEAALTDAVRAVVRGTAFEAP